MLRLRTAFVVCTCSLALAFGCSRKPPEDPAHGNLELTLPSSETDRGRNSTLTVNGKDYSEPRLTKRVLDVELKGPSEEVKVEFSFWPNSYTNIIRTKIVRLEKDKTVKADMTKEDPATPDLIKPIFVPTPPAVVTEMGNLAKVGPDDVVMDIGCGEGAMVLQIVKEFNPKKGIGLDIRDELIEKCKVHRKKEKLEDKVDFRVANALEIKDFSEATVVVLYLGDFLNQKLKPVLRETLKPGSRVVSHRFLMGDDWPPDETRKITAKDNYDQNDTFELHIWHIKKK